MVSLGVYLFQPKHGWLNVFPLRKRKVWQAVVYSKGRYHYLCTVPPNPSLSQVRKRVLAKYGCFQYAKRNVDRLVVTATKLAENVDVTVKLSKPTVVYGNSWGAEPSYGGHGVLYEQCLTGDLWIRLSRSRPYLCVCYEWLIVRTLCYLSRDKVRRFLLCSSDDEVIAYANSITEGRFKVEPHRRAYAESREGELSKAELWGPRQVVQDHEEDEGLQYYIDLIETWGIGALKEECDREEIMWLYERGVISREDYKWLTGEDPED